MNLQSTLLAGLLLVAVRLNVLASDPGPLSIVSAGLTNKQLSLTITSSVGVNYSLEARPSFDQPWVQVTSRTGTGELLTFTDTMDLLSRYYRVAATGGNPPVLVPNSPLLTSGVVSLVDLVQGASYSQTVSPQSTGSSTFQLQVTGDIPTGVTATVVSNATSNAKVVIASSGAGTVAGERKRMTITATDANGASTSLIYDLRIIAPPPAASATPQMLKAGAAASLPISASGGTPPLQWTLLSGSLPQGITFANGTLSGTPTVAAAEQNETGRYTNQFRITDSFTDRITGAASPRVTTNSVVTLVRLSYRLNLLATRSPNGPSLMSRCASCHDSFFAPDFSSQSSALDLIDMSSGSGGSCGPFRLYVTVGEPINSLVYLKVTTPPCGARMPDGGAPLTTAQADRLKRWIAELTASDLD